MIARIIITTAFLLLAASAAYSQANAAPSEPGPIRSSPAYSEVLLRKTELQAELESLLPDYTEANPKILDLRFELAAINKSLEKIYSVRPGDTGKLTLALGKLIVQKATLETDLARLLRTNTKDRPEVKRAQRKVEIFESAVNEVLR